METSSIAPNTCTVFIQVWVDVTTLNSSNPQQGCYVVVNRNGSTTTGQATPTMQTLVPTNSRVCWQILPIDPTFNGMLSFAAINVEFAYNQPPLPYTTACDVWTGVVASTQALNAIPCNLTLSFNNGADSTSLQLQTCVAPMG